MEAVKIPYPGLGMVDGVQTDVLESVERWCEYKLEDGSVLRAKPLVAHFVRLVGQYDADGNPLYALRGGAHHILHSAPENLKRPATDEGEATVNE